jgi:hypothetical protein
MSHLLARMPAALVAALCALWALALIAIPIVYTRVKGYGHYWAFSFDEVLRSLAFLLGPPVLLILMWRWARRRNRGEGAV